MNDEKKLFEVILAPSDRLEKELEDVLGGMGFCTSDECVVNSGNCVTNHCAGNVLDCRINKCTENGKVCPPGMVFDPATCSCIPIE